ncbi:MAG: PEGA domain-containing protein [Terriglobia bacterium]
MSQPDGADITVDGKYAGNTPSTLKLPPGDHAIKIEKPGFKAWERTITVSPGSEVTVSATLEQP